MTLSHWPDGLWTVSREPDGEVTGRLVRSGYRSAQLLILTIQSDDGCLHRYPIWSDQLPGRQFSYLQQQLAFACDAAANDRATHSV